MVLREDQLNGETRELLFELLPLRSSLNVTKEKLLALSFGDQAVFTAVIETFKNNDIKLSQELLLNVVKTAPLTSLSHHLQVLKFNGYTGIADLSQLQRIYLERSLAVLKPGFELNTNELREILPLLKEQATTQAFCAECIEMIIDHPFMKSQKGAILNLIIGNSEKAPFSFIKSLLGRLTLEDFQQVLATLRLEDRKQQTEAFDGAWTLEEYQVMKNLGMRMNAQQALHQLKSLFELRFNGDVKATDRLKAIQSDLSLAKGLLSKDEEVKLFTKEFFWAFDSDLREAPVLNIVKSVMNSEPEGLLVGDLDGAPLWLNPLYLFMYKDAHPMSQLYVIRKGKFQEDTLQIVSKRIDESWFLKSNSWSFSKHDLLWMNFLKHEDSSLHILPELKNPQVRNQFKKWSLPKTYDFADLKFQLSSSNKKFSSPDTDYRKKYLAALLLSEASDIKTQVLSEMIEKMPVNKDFQEKSILKEFTIYLTRFTNVNELDYVSDNMFWPYLLKLNPRFALAVKGDVQRYKDFLAGDLQADPLCHSGHTPAPKTCTTQEDFSLKTDNSNAVRDPLQNREHARRVMQEMKRKQEAKNKLILDAIALDRETIEAFHYFQTIGIQISNLGHFMKKNPWLNEIKFFTPDKSFVNPRFGN